MDVILVQKQTDALMLLSQFPTEHLQALEGLLLCTDIQIRGWSDCIQGWGEPSYTPVTLADELEEEAALNGRLWEGRGESFVELERCAKENAKAYRAVATFLRRITTPKGGVTP